MAELRPVYLVCGDDDVKIDAWRDRLRERAEAEQGPGALETFDAESSRPEELAAALATLSLAPGTRYLLADRVERWKAGELEPLREALASMPPATVLVLIARGKSPGPLAKAVEKAGGEVREHAAPKPWELPRWVTARAEEEGLRLDAQAAKALVALVGPRQGRLAREIEKLAVAVHPRVQLTAEEIEELCTSEESLHAYEVADALVAGDGPAALAVAERLRSVDERPARLIFPIVRRLREIHRAAELLDAGVPGQQLAGALKLAPWAAKRTIGPARSADRVALERALCSFADLEVEMRGGGELDEDTAFAIAVARAAG